MPHGKGGVPEINERQLRYFAKVVEAGSMTRAATLLNVAQPALGHQIRQLEDRLGVELLRRHSRGVETTEPGKLLYQHAVRILGMFEQAEMEIRALASGTRETIRLGVTHSIMRLVGEDVIVRAKDSMPQILLSLTEAPSTALRRDLENGDIDLALAYEVEASSAITHTPLLIEELLFAIRPDNAPAQKELSLEEVLRFEMVLAGPPDPIRGLLEREAARLGCRLNVGYEVQSLLATRKVVRNGLAASVLPFGVIADELETGALVSRPITGRPLERMLYLARRAHSPPFANETAVMKLVRSVVSQLSIDLGKLVRDPVTD